MKKEFQIKEPCNVGRENMKEIPGGSFCNLCSKKVHNLNDKSDEEIQSLLHANESICGRIQISRLYFKEEKTNTNYHFFNFPFRKIASGIFLATIITSNLNAQQAKHDTIDEVLIEGLIEYFPRNEDDSRDHYTPKYINLDIKYSGNKDLSNQLKIVSILKLEKRFTSNYSNVIRIPEKYLGFKNIFVVENDSNKNDEINQNQYYSFISENKFKDNGKTVDLNLEKIKKIQFKPKNKEFMYFLDGVEISKEDFEKKRNEKKIFSYHLSEIYARELIGDNGNYEDGIIISYTE